MIKKIVFIVITFFCVITNGWSATQNTCITAVAADTGTSGWHSISFKLTNKCGKSIDFQNSKITFNTTSDINTSFWGSFAPLSYPDNNLQITSQAESSGGYLASLSLHFPEQSWAKTVLPDNSFFIINFGTSVATYNPSTIKIYVSGSPVAVGKINLTSTTGQPSGLTHTSASIDIVSNGQIIQEVQLPWMGQQAVLGLSTGSYSLQPRSLKDSQGNSYQGTAVPATVTVTANQTVNSSISYTKIAKYGSINVKAPVLPSVLTGYTNIPSVILTRQDTGSTLTKALAWNAVTNVPQLDNNIVYTPSTPIINFNNNKCTGSFNPISLSSNATTPLTTVLSYSCAPIVQNSVTLKVNGLPSTTSSVNVILAPTDGSIPVTKGVNLTSGIGTASVNLNSNVMYNVFSTAVSGYAPDFSPQPLTAESGAIETIAYKKQTGGRIIGYLPGWKTPPSVTSLVDAGYTNILVAFGVFSTTTPGKIVPAFDTVSKAYITSLKNAGIKVSLSLGGASSSIPNTVTDFHQVLIAAPSSTVFQQTFIQSVESLVTQYGFDGIDIDIEHGFSNGIFTNPGGDIIVLKNILNTLHTNNPNLLISLVPQVANVSATPGFDATWGNYAALIMQTHDVLSWVGIQLYNTGCAFGIDHVCYDPNQVQSPNFAVAMATDLLENWPPKDSSGRLTGFRPYISYLNPSQVVLGYPVPDINGNHDGGPVTPTSTIKRAIQCLRTGVAGANSCDSYIPPKAYPNIGGVLNWEVTYDQSNNFRFATDLSACVKAGTC